MVHGHHRGPAPQGRERAGHERASVPRAHADSFAWLEAQPLEFFPQRLDLFPERTVIQRAGAIDNGRSVRPLAPGIKERVENIHAFICWRKAATASSSGRPAA